MIIFRALWGAALVFVVLMMLAYAGAVLPVLPWWSWPVAVLGILIIRRWRRARAAMNSSPANPDGPRFAPIGGGGK